MVFTYRLFAPEITTKAQVRSGNDRQGRSGVDGRAWKLSPSDFAFLWEECKRCFYLKVAKRFPRPRPIMPKIFNIIDGRMKECYSGRRSETIAPDLPPGLVRYGERWVESKRIVVPGHESACFIRGKFDTVIEFDDGTYGVVDFKTSERKAEHIPLYGRQLHAYAHALENPARGKFALNPISKLGLLVYEPSSYEHNTDATANLTGDLSWIEIVRDDEAFMDFLAEVLSVLESPEPPRGSPSCEWCRYRDTSRRTGL